MIILTTDTAQGQFHATGIGLAQDLRALITPLKKVDMSLDVQTTLHFLQERVARK